MVRRWIAHTGHAAPPWMAALRRELVAAFLRGTMDAERCLRTYRDQGERAMLPPEALVYLASRATAEGGAGPSAPRLAAESLLDHGEAELAEMVADPMAYAILVEAGRRFFFSGRLAVG